ncbi:MAG: hypothetical protein J6J36_07965 [Clostridia bacterium]|nr:hypothetical protein [Clostridia bacterium]
MQTKITGIDYLDRYNFQRGFIDYLPEDESGTNALLMERKKMYEEYQKRKQKELEKQKIIIDKKDLKSFEEQVAEEITQEIEKLLK